MGHVLTEEELFCLRGCRSYEQYYRMRKGFEEGVCAFCTLDTELNVVIFENMAWRVWEVHPKFLRKELSLHMLIVPRDHVRFPWDLPWEAHVDLDEVWRWIEQKYADRIKGGVIAARIGDMSFNAGTVPHYHINLYVPNKTGEFRIPIFKNEEDAVENQRRMEEFSAHYQSGEKP